MFPAVRYGRVPKRSRERSVEDNPSRVSTTAPDVISVVSPAPNTTEAMSPTSAVPNTTTITTTTTSVVIDNDIKQLAVYDIILGITQVGTNQHSEKYINISWLGTSCKLQLHGWKNAEFAATAFDAAP